MDSGPGLRSRARMRIGLIVDRGRVARWQAAALATLPPGCAIHLYNCGNSRTRRKLVANGAYYALKSVARSSWERLQPLSERLPIVSRIVFDAVSDGAWQRLPDDLLERVRADRPECIVKFGMGLLRVPAKDALECPILSYHHGDPRQFRGRPTALHELASGEATIGQVVQILSDKLDSGAVVAFGESKVHSHSLRSTLTDAYRISPLLLVPAIATARTGMVMPIGASGTNYRLPSNTCVLRLVGHLLTAKLRRGAYGMMSEKQWAISRAPIDPAAPLDTMLASLRSTKDWRDEGYPERYGFVADPFFDPTGDGILAEALNRAEQRGEIVRLTDGCAITLLTGPSHLSYPSTLKLGDDHFVLPEMKQWPAQQAYRLTGDGLESVGTLRLPAGSRLTDPTLHAAGDRLYLFANLAGEGSSVLRLWSAPDLTSDFIEHPASPIRVSPLGSRMAGVPFVHSGTLYRAGQDGRRGYGDGIALFRIESLDVDSYRETLAAEFRFDHRRGPHTLNVSGSSALFDHYVERRAALAGYRRARQAFNRWRADRQTATRDRVANIANALRNLTR